MRFALLFAGHGILWRYDSIDSWRSKDKEAEIDSLFHQNYVFGMVRKGRLGVSNVEMVAKMKRIIVELGYEAATPDEAWVILHLK